MNSQPTLTIKDVLQSKSSAIWSVGPQDNAFSAMEIMAEKNIGVLVVIDEENVAGIVSERDFARKLFLKEMSPRKVKIEELMTRDIYCITSDKSVEECMGVMMTAHIRHMPVFDNSRLVGVLTFADILRAYLLEQEVKIQDLEDYHTCCDSVSYED